MKSKNILFEKKVLVYGHTKVWYFKSLWRALDTFLENP